MNYEVHIETWMLDAETADWIVTDPGWLESQSADAANRATNDGKTVNGTATYNRHTYTGPANDGGLMYDVVFDVPIV
jgi:hypothetical protein